MLGSIKQGARNAAHRVEDTIESARDSVTGLGDSVRSAARSAASTVEGVFEAGKEKVEDIVEGARDTVFSGQRAAADTAEAAKDSARSASRRVSENVERGKNVAADAVDSVKGAARSAKRNLENTVDKATSATSRLGDTIASNVAAQGHEFENAAPAGIVENAKRFVEQKWEQGKEAAADLVGSAKSATRNLGETAEQAKATARDAAYTAKRSLDDTVESAKDAAARAQRNLASSTAAVGHEIPSDSLGDTVADTTTGVAASAKRFVEQKWEQGKEAAAEVADAAGRVGRSAKRNLDAKVDEAKAGARDTARSARRNVEDTVDQAQYEARRASRVVGDSAAAQGHEVPSSSDSVLGSARAAAGSIFDSVRNVASKAAGFVTGRGETPVVEERVVEEKRSVTGVQQDAAAYPKVKAAQVNTPGQADQGSVDLSGRRDQALPNQQNPQMGAGGGQAAADAMKGDEQWRRAQQTGEQLGDQIKRRAEEISQRAGQQQQQQQAQQAAADMDRRMPRSAQQGIRDDRDVPQGVHEGQRRLDPHPGATLDPIQAAKTVLPRGASRAALEKQRDNLPAGTVDADVPSIPRVPEMGQGAKPEVPRTQEWPGAQIPDQAQNPDRRP